MLHDYYMIRTKKERLALIDEIMAKCMIREAIVKVWVRDHNTKFHRKPNRIYRAIISKITGVAETELFKL